MLLPSYYAQNYAGHITWLKPRTYLEYLNSKTPVHVCKCEQVYSYILSKSVINYKQFQFVDESTNILQNVAEKEVDKLLSNDTAIVNIHTAWLNA